MNYNRHLSGLWLPPRPGVFVPPPGLLAMSNLNLGPSGGGSLVSAADPIQYVGAASTTGGAQSTTSTDIVFDVSSLTGGIDTAAREDDLVVCLGANGTTADSNVSTPTGYTSVLSELYQNSSYDSNIEAFYKVQTATPDTTVTIPIDSVRAQQAIAMVFRGVDLTTPLDVTTTSSQAGGAVWDPPSITPVTAGAWIIIAGCQAHASGSSYDLAQSEMDVVVADSVNDNTDVSAIMGYYDGWSSGAFDPAICTWGGSASFGTNAGYSIALRPAA